MLFVDTNVLLYSISPREAERPKSRIALDLLKTQHLGLSVQVLQEFYVQATRPNSLHPLTTAQAADLVRSFTRFAVQQHTVDLVLAGVATSRRFSISYWDAAVIEAARALGCAELLSEDLNDGQDYDGVVVRNPFAQG